MFQILENPDNVPGAVTSGYQRQNTNLFVLQTGLDTTEPFDDGSGAVTIPMGGVVELNGVMFRLTSEIVLAKPDVSTAYWVAVGDDGEGYAGAELVTRPGAWNPAKNGSYLADGRRTLNWVSLGDVDLTDIDEDSVVFSQTVKGSWEINLKKGWYVADMSSGLGGGDGAGGGVGNIGGGGGVANKGKILRKPFFHEAKKDCK